LLSHWISSRRCVDCTSCTWAFTLSRSCELTVLLVRLRILYLKLTLRTILYYAYWVPLQVLLDDDTFTLSSKYNQRGTYVFDYLVILGPVLVDCTVTLLPKRTIPTVGLSNPYLRKTRYRNGHSLYGAWLY
jgi:hypothetical protein